MIAPRASKAGSEVSDETFGLLSILYHTLKECEKDADFAADAEAVGDNELYQFFCMIREQDQGRAKLARELLAKRIDKLACLETPPKSLQELTS